MDTLQQRLGHRFVDQALLSQALTHKSYANEHRPEEAQDNERLEFLGDAVLDLVVSEALHSRQPLLSEGEMTRIRAEVVSEKGLSFLARDLGVGKRLRLGRGEELTGGRDKDSLLADATEALFGAVFCDGGFDAARKVILGLLEQLITRAVDTKSGLDAKTRLQEILQARHGQLPSYVLAGSEGPDHDRSYLVEVRFQGETIAAGRGRTKKQAEQQAAARALRQLES
ncbi:ribonuclease III [Geothermobacter hydrogeniphilus]|uniref:Ribonuclease 3 n=1 Tax=Geothermobacter hydrogeniphilus TaxID=1969733 RepID=A0A1X0YEC6_9BACT|nr:ribonuclease III [Geothermobacter hydrogeniphilus]ORJ63334.1 ribonuclease III [Geothermobacter hydrogeniphilus]